jgi:membrane protease YdiL (CAAX protease family)
VSLLLHLAPGVVTMAVYLMLLPVATSWTLPSAAALGGAALLATAPLLGGVLLWVALRHPQTPVVTLRRMLGARAIVGWAALLIASAIVAFLIVSPANRFLERSVFGAWRQHWKPQLGTAGDYSQNELLVTALLVLMGSALAAPVVEELYFRGFLLPRMPRALGRTAPLVHTLLFALYHLWTPWLAPTRILAVLPLTYVALRVRSVVPGIVAHVVLNILDVVVIVQLIVNR